jgi:hypothetical protein
MIRTSFLTPAGLGSNGYVGPEADPYAAASSFCRYCGRTMEKEHALGDYDMETGVRLELVRIRCPSVWCRVKNSI